MSICIECFNLFNCLITLAHNGIDKTSKRENVGKKLILLVMQCYFTTI